MSLENVKNIVLVLSGKGGVGKSSITTQLALSLSLAGHSVGILDIDLTGPSIPRLLGIEASKVKQAPGGWLPVEVHLSQTLPPAPPTTYPLPIPTTALNGSNNEAKTPSSIESTNGSSTIHPPPSSTAPTNGHNPSQPTQIGSLHAMSLAFLLTTRSSAIVWRGPKKTAMVRQFLTSVLWPPTDYLLIDTPPGTSDEHISLVETLLKDVAAPLPPTNGSSNGVSPAPRSKPQLAGAVIVTTPQAVAISDVKKELNFCGKTGVKVLGVVENMSGYVCECCGVSTNLFSKGGGEVMAREFGVPFLGGVPLDGQWGVLVEEGVRPRYGTAANNGDGGDGEDFENGKVNENAEAEEQMNGSEEGVRKREKEEGLLVDKYRNCSLSPVFAEIRRKMVETVETGTAVSVRGAV
ncbi:cytosolic Fe-S cluster assembly factor cfd1 [Trapelia coarctata]|nr:cytosolic Fe-S cluster assembly factor cfd1 [Trapelia coarctata]